ncbi:MAG: hypothetical protein IH802_06240 [Nitrospinae bacterium]|nr:hypothetical protein [Nitrospinota bacterium]
MKSLSQAGVFSLRHVVAHLFQQLGLDSRHPRQPPHLGRDAADELRLERPVHLAEELAHAVEDGLAAVDLDSPEGMDSVADEGVGASVDGPVRQVHVEGRRSCAEVEVLQHGLALVGVDGGDDEVRVLLGVTNAPEHPLQIAAVEREVDGSGDLTGPGGAIDRVFPSRARRVEVHPIRPEVSGSRPGAVVVIRVLQ